MPQAMSKPVTLAPGQERSVTVLIKSLRNPPLDIKLTSQPLATSLLDLKNTVSIQTRIPVGKMRLLHKKKPLPDSKILKDIVGESDISVEFSVMVIGGAAVPIVKDDEPMTDATASDTGAAQLETRAFWEDLEGFLLQRLKDEKAAEELSKLFRSSWEAKR
jgi:ubiquitin-like protein 4